MQFSNFFTHMEEHRLTGWGGRQWSKPDSPSRQTNPTRSRQESKVQYTGNKVQITQVRQTEPGNHDMKHIAT